MNEINSNKFTCFDYNLKIIFNDSICRTSVLVRLIFLFSLLLTVEVRQAYGNADVIDNRTDTTSNTSYFGNTNGEWLNTALFTALNNYTPKTSTVSTLNNSICTNHGLLYRLHLRNLTKWAVQMYDSGVHSVGGIITADRYQLGHFDECLNISYPAYDIKGRYCLVTLKYGPSFKSYKEFYSPPAPAYLQDPPPDSVIWDKIKRTQDPRMVPRDVLHLGVCVPSSCTFSDVQDSLNLTINHTFHNHNLYGEIQLDKSSCYSKDDESFSTGYYVMAYTLIFLCCVSVIATLYDYFLKPEEHPEINSSDPVDKFSNSNGSSSHVEKIPSKLDKTIMAFSMRENFNDLVKEGVNESLDVLNGGRFISLFVIIIGHRTMFTLGSALYNPEYWEESVINVKHMTFMNSTQVVDTFFLIGGYLTFLGIYQYLEKTKRLNLPVLLFFRWLRLMPAYITMIGIYAFLLEHVGSGPVWNMKVGVESENCRESWWLNVLFINNYVTPEKQCLLMSWYLACDMHFFIIGACIVYVLWRLPNLGELICAVALGVGMVIPFIVTYIGLHDGKLRLYQKLLRNPYVDNEFNSVYIRSHSRSIPYLCGIIIGYICFRMKKANFVIPRRINIAGISIFFIMYAVQVYSLVIYTPGRSYDALENAIFSAILPLSWSIGSGWIIAVQTTTGLGFYKWLFAQKFYTPLSRLSYCVVLIHPMVQVVHEGSNVSSEFLNYPRLIWMTCGDTAFSYVLALLLYLMVEAPFRNLQKLWIQPGGGNRKKSKTAEENTQKNLEQNHAENVHQTSVQIIPMTIKGNKEGSHHITENGTVIDDNR